MILMVFSNNLSSQKCAMHKKPNHTLAKLSSFDPEVSGVAKYLSPFIFSPDAPIGQKKKKKSWLMPLCLIFLQIWIKKTDNTKVRIYISSLIKGKFHLKKKSTSSSNSSISSTPAMTHTSNTQHALEDIFHLCKIMNSGCFFRFVKLYLSTKLNIDSLTL